MTERGFSKTALGVAALRAAHQLIDGEPKILHDPVILKLLDRETLAGIPARAADLNSPRAAGLRAHVLLRSRYAEDCLAQAASRGVRQYVILGAGFDTFAYRQPEWARVIRVFEADHPASQGEKRKRLESAGIPLPPNLQFVEVDFETGALRQSLISQGVDPGQPVFFSCLGVMVYLSEPAVDDLLQVVASFPADSEMVFTFSPPDSSSEGSAPEAVKHLAAAAESMGEPWRTRLEPEVLERKLRQAGFSEVLWLSPEESASKYFQGRWDGLRAPRRGRIGRAVVGGTSELDAQSF